jgi:hypothetical protein
LPRRGAALNDGHAPPHEHAQPTTVMLKVLTPGHHTPAAFAVTRTSLATPSDRQSTPAITVSRSEVACGAGGLATATRSLVPTCSVFRTVSSWGTLSLGERRMRWPCQSGLGPKTTTSPRSWRAQQRNL